MSLLKLRIKNNRISFFDTNFSWKSMIRKEDIPLILQKYYKEDLEPKQYWALLNIQKIQKENK